MLINVVFTFLDIVLDRKAITQKRIIQARSVREEKEEGLTFSTSNFNSEIISLSCQPSTALKLMKCR